MRGYLRPLHPAGGVDRLYRSTLCGLCHAVGAAYGLRNRLLAGPDLVFYAVFLDASAGARPVPGARACVLTPGLRRLPARLPDEHLHIAAAFGVWMAVAKLRDDVVDEGGLLRRLAWRAMAPGGRHARRVLAEHGFPVEAVEGWLDTQAALERAGPLPLDEAAGPSEAIARLAFGFRGGPAAGAIGEHVGAFLFLVDNLLDHAEDLRAGRYNALAVHEVLGPEQVRTVLERARAHVAEIAALLDRLAVPGPTGRLLRSTLVDGFTDKLRRLAALPDLAGADLPAICPPRPSRWRRLREGLARSWRLAWWKARAAAALALAAVLPRSALAERWWPRDAPPLGLADASQVPLLDTGLDTGFDLGGTQEGEHAADTYDFICDAFASNCGWCDVDGCLGGNCQLDCGDACAGSDCGSCG